MNVQSSRYCFGSESSFLTVLWVPGTGEDENSQGQALHVLVQKVTLLWICYFCSMVAGTFLKKHWVAKFVTNFIWMKEALTFLLAAVFRFPKWVCTPVKAELKL